MMRPESGEMMIEEIEEEMEDEPPDNRLEQT
jgi:hypothetical protein